MDKHELAVKRGDEAHALLNNATLSAAFEDTRQAMLEALAGMDNMRGEQAQDLHRMIKCLVRVRRCLEEHVTTGKIAQKEIEGRSRLFGLRRA